MDHGPDVQQSLAQALLQGHAVEELHCDERSAGVIAHFVDRANIRMVEGGCGLRFPLQARLRLRISCRFGGKKLQCYKSPEVGIFGFVNHTHVAVCYEFNNLVVDGDELTCAELDGIVRPQAGHGGRREKTACFSVFAEQALHFPANVGVLTSVGKELGYFLRRKILGSLKKALNYFPLRGLRFHGWPSARREARLWLRSSRVSRSLERCPTPLRFLRLSIRRNTSARQSWPDGDPRPTALAERDRAPEIPRRARAKKQSHRPEALHRGHRLFFPSYDRGRSRRERAA